VTLFHMVAGKHPFVADTMENLYRIIIAGRYTIPDYLSDGAEKLLSCEAAFANTHRVCVDQAARMSCDAC
jgi:hypothetical protein